MLEMSGHEVEVSEVKIRAWAVVCRDGKTHRTLGYFFGHSFAFFPNRAAAKDSKRWYDGKPCGPHRVAALREGKR